MTTPDRIPPGILAPEGVEAVDAALSVGQTDHPAVSGFTVDTPELAAWAGAKMGEAQQLASSIREQARFWRARIDQWERDALSLPLQTVTFMEHHLERFGLAERARTNGKVKSVSLPSGVIRTREGSPTFVMVDADVFMDWAQDNVPDAVKWVRSPLTSKLTGMTSWDLADGAVYAEVYLASTGEKIPGLLIDPGSTSAKVTVD